MRPGPPGLSPEQRAEAWCRWKAGHGVKHIGRALGFDHGSIRGVLIQRGGIAPPVRKRARSAIDRKVAPEAMPLEMSSRSMSVSAEQARLRCGGAIPPL